MQLSGSALHAAGRWTVLWVVMVFLVGSRVAGATNVLSVSSSTAGASETVTVTIGVDNTDDFVAVQFDLLFSDELRFADGSARLTSRADDHVIQASLIEPGRLRLVAYSAAQRAFQGTTGALVQLEFTTGTTPGTYPLTLRDALVADADERNILTAVRDGQMTLRAPDLVVEAEAIDFGDVPLEESRTAAMTIRNRGNQALVVSGTRLVGADFTIEGPSSTTLEPGARLSRSVTFQPAAKGAISGRITITTDDPDAPSTSVSLNGVGYAVNELHVGDVSGRSGRSVTVPVVVDNMEPFVAVELALPLPDVVRYVPGSAVLAADRAVDHVIQADTSGGVLTLVAYSGSNTSFQGTRGDVLHFELFVEGDGGRYVLPVESPVLSDAAAVNILSAVHDGGLNVAAARLQVSETQLDFGRVALAEQVSSTVTISNAGDDVLHLTALKANSEVFAHDLSLPMELSVGQSEAVTITFDAVREGSYDGTFALRSNDATHDPLYLHATASVFAPVTLSVIDGGGRPGETATVAVGLSNAQPVAAFQFDLALPEVLAPEHDGARLTARTQHFTLSTTEVSPGVLRVVAYAPDLQPVSGTDGPVFEIPVQIGQPGSSREPSMQLKGAVASSPSGENVLSAVVDGVFAVLNMPPSAHDDEVETDEDVAVAVDVLANDTDVDGDGLDITAVGDPSNGRAVVDDGRITYVPDADFHGGDAFTYTVSDGNGGETSAAVAVTVTPVNDAPAPATITRPEDGGVVHVAGRPTDAVVVAWSASEDVDDNDISYVWQAALSEDGLENPSFSRETQATSLEITIHEFAAVLDAAGVREGESAMLYHRTHASDGRATTIGSVSTVALEHGRVTSTENEAPVAFALISVFPNPTSSSTIISFNLAEAAEVTLDVYDVLGRLAARMDAGPMSAGANRQVAISAAGLRAGSYIYRLTAMGARSTDVASGRLTVVR